MKFVDTNIFLRYLTEDDVQKAKNCEELFKKAKSGKEKLFTSHLAKAEIIWVLDSFYGVLKAEIVDMVKKILNTPNLFVDDIDLLVESLELYLSENIDFIDAYHAVLLKQREIRTLYSYDKDFDSIPWLKRFEP